jgi:hypothetical protein
MNKLLKFSHKMISTKMRAILQKSPGEISSLYIGDTDIPVSCNNNLAT